MRTRTGTRRTSYTDRARERSVRGMLSDVMRNGPQAMSGHIDRILALAPDADGLLLMRLCLSGVRSPKERESILDRLLGR